MEKYFMIVCFTFCILVHMGSLNCATQMVSGEIVCESKKVALTFDDGPHPVATPMLLRALKERNVQATFFVLGKSAELYPELIEQELKEGHLVGNHTYDHIDFRTMDNVSVINEIEKTNKILREITGKNPEYIRPPFGEWREEINGKTGLMPVLWSVDSLDWKTENIDEIVKKVVTDIEENDIILLHDCYESTVEATIQIVDILRKEGYQFVTVDELLLD